MGDLLLAQQKHLADLKKDFPNVWKQVDDMRAERGKSLPFWPDWCFLPMAGAYAIASGGTDMPSEGVSNVSRIAALAAWRPTMGIYRFDPDLYAELVQTEMKGKLPIEILYRLPEWCVYIETGEQPEIAGYYVHLEWDMNEKRPELRFLLHWRKGELSPLVLHLLDGATLEDSLESVIQHTQRMAKLHGTADPHDIQAISAFQESSTNLSRSLLQPVLYLCSESADYASDPPSRPTPVKTKKGPRLFPPNLPKIWDMGFRIGEAFRSARQRSQSSSNVDPTGRTVTPHIRRAHWHTYLTGPRDNPRPILKWLNPVLVAGSQGDLVPTIREVN